MKATLRTLPVVFVFWSMVASGVPASADSPELAFRDLLLPRLPPFARPFGSTDDWDEWHFQRIARAGRREFLVLFEHRVYRYEGVWRDGEAKTLSGRREDVSNELTLTIVNDRGTILHQAPTPAEAVVKHPANVGREIPLVMDRTNDCPYALLDPGSGVLWCYDHQLASTGKHEIPLEEIDYPRVTFDGERYTLWLFGSRFARGAGVTPREGGHDGSTGGSAGIGEEGKVPDFVSRFDVPRVPAEALGVRYDVTGDSWEPLPLDAGELAAELGRIARGPDGERLRVQPASIQVTPFRDLDTDEGFGVLIQGVAADDYGNRALFSGTRLFFRSVMDRQGLGKITQLPLWLVQEDRRDVVLDEDTGVFRFPSFTRVLDLQPFGLGKNDLALAFLWFVKVPGEDGSYGRGGRGGQVMVLFSGAGPPRILDLSPEVLSEKARDAAFSMDELEILPVRLVDRIGPREFAFRALCDSRRNPGERRSCIAVMELDW